MQAPGRRSIDCQALNKDAVWQLVRVIRRESAVCISRPAHSSITGRAGRDLRSQSLAFLTEHSGKVEGYYYGVASGQDDRPVEADRMRKSIGAEVTSERDIRDWEEATLAVDSLAAKCWSRVLARIGAHGHHKDRVQDGRRPERTAASSRVRVVCVPQPTVSKALMSAQPTWLLPSVALTNRTPGHVLHDPHIGHVELSHPGFCSWRSSRQVHSWRACAWIGGAT